MAIKGKKKSQARGSQGVRRPAQAPRPVAGPRTKTPWYRTRDGMLVGGIFLAVALGVVIWAVMAAQNRAEEAEAQRTTLQDYTEQIEAALEDPAATASEMGALTTLPEEDDEVAALATDGERWATELGQAEATLATVLPDPQAEAVHAAFGQSIRQLSDAAETFALVPEVEGRTQRQLFNRAVAQQTSALAVWSTAIDFLDQLRRDNDMSSSGLRTPSAELPEPEPSAEPSPQSEVTIGPEGGGGGGGGDNNDGNGGDG